MLGYAKEARSDRSPTSGLEQLTAILVPDEGSGAPIRNLEI
jgi:hypothetical protein